MGKGQDSLTCGAVHFLVELNQLSRAHDSIRRKTDHNEVVRKWERSI
jgi:hypothetical protein